MVKSAPIGIRVEPEVKAALEKAAKDETRSVASLLEHLAIKYLKDGGYLK